MSAWNQARDRDVLPLSEFTTQLATLEPPPPEMQQLLGAVASTIMGAAGLQGRCIAVRLRAICCVHSPHRFAVKPQTSIRRLATSITNNTW